MLDIHAHLIPGIDDGAIDISMSKGMIETYKKEGINNVICTPHMNYLNKDIDSIKKAFENLKLSFKEANINLYLGSEIYYYENMIKDLKNNELLTLNNSKYILVEFSMQKSVNIPEVIYDLVVNGYIPIVAHIERYDYLTSKDLNEIKKNGGLIQINSLSFIHKSYKKTLKYLLKNKMVDFISSDCHNDTDRNVSFDDAKRIINKKYKDQYEKLFNNDNFINKIL